MTRFGLGGEWWVGGVPMCDRIRSRCAVSKLIHCVYTSPSNNDPDTIAVTHMLRPFVEANFTSVRGLGFLVPGSFFNEGVGSPI